MTPKIRNAKLNKSRKQELFEQGAQFLHEKDYEDAYTFFLEAHTNWDFYIFTVSTRNKKKKKASIT